MSFKDNPAFQEMELFQTEDYHILLNKESSLWCNRKTAEFEVKPAWELANSGDPECLGIFYGLVGKVNFQLPNESRLMLIKEVDEVGKLPDGRTVLKVCSIAFVHPCGPDATPSEIGLRACKKHKGGNRALFDIPQKAALAKTWGTIKSATNSIKNTTQQAATLATYQVKGGPTKKDVKDKEKFEKRILEELNRVFTETESFYFCLGPPGSQECDLTNSLQHQFDNNFVTDDRFFWNKHMLKEVIELDDPLANTWILPIIQGYIQIEDCVICADSSIGGTGKDETIKFGIISRRSRYRAGTRYKRRGLDENGKCANYVETEQIVATNDYIVSFVQVRGSVPLYWSQPGYKYRPPPRIDRGMSETKGAFEKHIKEELKLYGPICIVNLVEQSGKEKVIWDGFTQQVLEYNSDDLTYATFDFHEHCRGMKFENVSLLVSRLEEMLQEMSFCWKDAEGIICKQNGVFRVNCIDCLDRTNVVQTAIAKSMLEIQLTKLGLLPPEGSLPPSLRSTFQLLWANNGDVISKQYAGTNALKGDYTRTGERKFTGMMKDGMNSANRYYLSRFKDVYRQATIDIMQGNFVSDDLLNEDETDSTATAEHVKLLIEDCKKLLITDASLVLGAWGLINADPITGDPSESEMDTILILTRDSYYVADYDDEIDKVTKCQQVPLSNITMVELGPMEMSTIFHPPSALHIFNKGKSKLGTQYCLRFRYKLNDGSVLAHTFRSGHLRFFNNVAVVIKTEEEMIESLRAICDCVRVALEVSGTKDIEWFVGDPLPKLPIMATLQASAQLTRNISETQLENIRNVGSKAFSNMTSKFSKLGSTFHRNKDKSEAEPPTQPNFEIGDDSEEDDDVICVVSKNSDTFMPNVGIVMSNTYIGSGEVDASDITVLEAPEIQVEASKDDRPKTLPMNHSGSDLKVRTFSHSSGEVDLNDKQHLEVQKEAQTDGDVILGISSSQSENALRSLKSGFSTATNVLTSPSAVLSPLSKLAKGVQSLGANLDPRKLKNKAAPYQPSTETLKLQEMWDSTGCKSRLIAV